MVLTTLISTPKRGPYGDSKFPGNCSGNAIKEMLLYFKPKYVLDPMEGSGTCRDVCKELEIKYDGYDIINGHDIFKIEFKQKYDFIHWHPPYFKMCVEQYLALCDNNNNLSYIKDWKVYVVKIYEIFLKLFYTALKKNGIVAILCGIRRENNRIYDIASHLAVQFENFYIYEIIKVQHMIDYKALSIKNFKKYTLCLKNNTYTKQPTLYGNPFIPTKHEKYVLFKRK